MTTAASAPGGYDQSEMNEVLRQACAIAGLDPSDAQLLRGHTNAVILLRKEEVVVKIARRGSDAGGVRRTVEFVRWLMDMGFPTVPLHNTKQPVVVDEHSVTFWTYLPQPEHPVDAAQLAKPLHALHTLPSSAMPVRDHNNLRAIRKSLAAITCLPASSLQFLSRLADQLEEELHHVEFVLQEGIIQGDPQHRNALHSPDGGAVLCDWDTVAHGQPEWDLVTVEVHCRRFGYGSAHYQGFVEAYGWDVVDWPGYATLAAVRELRMITTNAAKVHHAPATQDEVERRVDGLRRNDPQLRWRIL
ncbi:phosphotransferase [Streptomyces lydicus]|uniref:phosphotransferase n=1 Tax=Streptomyces lydicus TaxID=47763 RepID=UPI0033CB0B5F